MSQILKVIKKWFDLPLWQQVMVGLLLGIIAGLVFRTKMEAFEPVGSMFIAAIQMLVGPVVLTSIVCAILSLNSYQLLRRILSKAIILYAVSMAVAAVIGISIANLLHTGKGLIISSSVDTLGIPSSSAMAQMSFAKILLGVVPKSPIEALANNNVLQILVFAVILGIALKSAGPQAKLIQDIFISFSKVVFRFCHIVISFAPYAIFALIASVFGHYGLMVLLPLIKFVVSIYLSCIILILFYYTGVLMLRGISPKFFLKSIITPMTTAYITSSSAATLPVTMRCAREDLKLDPGISDFLLPLGTNLNLNGLAIYLSSAAVFSAHIFGISLDFYHYMALVVSIIFIAAGAAAIPGSALIVMGAVMQSSGIPLGALPLIAGVDRFNDMAQTATNVIGDLFAAVFVAKGEKLTKAQKNIVSHTKSQVGDAHIDH